MVELTRITQNPAVMSGKPCIRGMRITVGMVLEELSEGTSQEQLLAYFPQLEALDISQCLKYAAWQAQAREVQLIGI
jgi:uncharacterized protein (DUF433 family)